MRRNWLASAAVAAVAISVPVTAVTGPTFAGTAQAATLSGQQKTTQASAASTPKRVLVTWNMLAAARAKGLVGRPYVWGGNTIHGFDCSGLTQWVYGHTGHGKHIQRTAEAQFLEFRRISHARARPGDLVFFHVSSYPGSYVYHVGVYEGGEYMVAATTYGEGVRYQSFAWGGNTVTFGTITH